MSEPSSPPPPPPDAVPGHKPATDAMQCRACGQEERASEGYPCEACGTFICLICTVRGVTRCRRCQEAGGVATG